MAAPAVQSIQDVISQLTQANQPVLDNLNQQDSDITNSATAGTQAIDASKDAAFGGITNQANQRGAVFSGFTPDAQAKYTSATYLPALAKLQQSITDSRTALAGQKASLLAGIGTQANQTVQQQQTALQAYQDAQDKAAEDAKTLQQQEQFTAGQNALDRGASAANAAASASAKAAAASQANGSVVQQPGGGYSFYDAKGNPINASAYAALNKTSLASVLAGSKNGGDQKFLTDYNGILNAISQGTITRDQAQAALRADYPNLGNITL